MLNRQQSTAAFVGVILLAGIVVKNSHPADHDDRLRYGSRHFLTLLYVPIFYTIFEDLTLWVGRMFGKGK